MAELVFPIAATLALVLVAIPVATLLCKAILLASRPAATALGLREAGSNARYLLLIAPVCVPAVWLVSAAVHHAEAEEAALTCLFEHLSDDLCTEPLVIALVVAVMLAGTFVWRRRLATRAVAARAFAHDGAAQLKIDAACAAQPRLRELSIRLIEGDEIRTVGLVRRHVEVSAELARALGVDELAAALLHEAEHVRSFDPLRFVVVSVLQTLNPASGLLADEVLRWRAGREAVCDEGAVHHGADPCGLAEALVHAARPRAPQAAAAAHLGGGGMALLRLRVTLLMSYVTSPPRCLCSRRATKLASVAFPLLAALPHYWGDNVLVEIHQRAERMAVDTFIAAP